MYADGVWLSWNLGQFTSLFVCIFHGKMSPVLVCAGLVIVRRGIMVLCDQLPHALLSLIGLGGHGRRRLVENLRLCERGGLRREVDVFNPRPGFRQVGHRGL